MSAPKDLQEFLTMVIGKDNPFSDAFVKREVRWYNKGNFSDNGVRVQVKTPLCRLDDYLNLNYRIDKDFKVPILYIDDVLWMSLTPMELQSQFLAINNASGNVGIAGLGMGYAALKMAQKDCVDSVTVFEIDERVVKFFKRSFRRRKGFNKIRFVVGDARKTILTHGTLFDFLYIDVYQTLLPDAVISDIELFRCSVHTFPGGYHFWGQERVFVDATIGHAIFDGGELPLSLRAYLTFWQQTPVSTDPRLADTMFSDMYRIVCDSSFCEEVLDALGTEY